MSRLPEPFQDQPDARARRARTYRSGLPLGNDPAAIRQRVEAMKQLLERCFVLPLIRREIGLDAILGFVLPVIGDLITAALGAYIVWEARNLGLPRWKLWRMSGNLAIDTLLGSVPLAGDLFDVMFRSNTYNLNIIRRHLDKHHPDTRIIEG